MKRAYLGLGSNLGDRLSQLQFAIDELKRNGQHVTKVSQIYETDPVGPPQPDYLNAVVAIETDLTARELLDIVLDIESQTGRERREKWGPRTLDVDLLWFDNQHINESDLQVPHPRMNERSFVLVPLADLAPDLVPKRPFDPGVRLTDFVLQT